MGPLTILVLGGRFWNALICDETPPPIVTGVTVGVMTWDAADGCTVICIDIGIGVIDDKKLGALFSDKSLLALLELDNSESCDGDKLWSRKEG